MKSFIYLRALRHAAHTVFGVARWTKILLRPTVWTTNGLIQVGNK